MHRALWKKTVAESQWLLGACAIVLFAYCWLRVWTLGLIDMSRFEKIVEQFRDFERFSPVPIEQLVTYAGRIAMSYDEPIVMVMMTVWAIARGSDAVSGELGRGTMEMLLAQPVSRLKVLLTHAAVTVAGVAILSAVAWSGTAVGIGTTTVKARTPPKEITLRLPLWGQWKVPVPPKEGESARVPISQKVRRSVFLPAALNLFSLGFFLAGLTTLVSSWDRYRWRTIGIVASICVVQTMIDVLGMAAEGLHWLKYWTFYTAYDPVPLVVAAHQNWSAAWVFVVFNSQGHLTGLGPLGYDALFWAMGLASYVAAAVIFCRRDLPAPL